MASPPSVDESPLSSRFGLGHGREAAPILALAGLTYPFWTLIGPARSPFWIGFGIAIGLGLVSTAIAGARWKLSRETVSNLAVSAGTLVTLHWFLLASSFDMTPNYAVGSSMSILATLLFIRTRAGMLAYALFVASLGIGLYVYEPDYRKLVFWFSPLPTFLFAFQWLSGQLAVESRLQDLASERTRQLADVNARLHDEIEVRSQLEQELRLHYKSEAVGRLAGGIAHDFNNLLTTIAVYADLILDGLPEDSPLRGELAQIQEAQRKAVSITQQLLTLGRRSYAPLRSLDLNAVLRDMQPLLERMLRGHQLVFELAEGAQLIRGNEDQLQQVVINLVSNARDALNGPGRVTIETERRLRRELEGGFPTPLESDEYVMLSVTDTGCGMDAEVRDRVFDPFFSTKPSDRGFGLGLSLVHGIVGQVGGHLRLSSEPGRGARFELFWPRAQPSRDVDHSRLRPSEPIQQAEILLVEDEGAIRLALHRVLANAGYSVTDAADGEDALRILKNSNYGFDLVVSDVVMPGLSGLDLAERVRESHPAAKVLLISGRLDERAMSHAAESFPLLAKPFAPKDLLARIGDLLGH